MASLDEVTLFSHSLKFSSSGILGDAEVLNLLLCDLLWRGVRLAHIYSFLLFINLSYWSFDSFLLQTLLGFLIVLLLFLRGFLLGMKSLQACSCKKPTCWRT